MLDNSTLGLHLIQELIQANDTFELNGKSTTDIIILSLDLKSN